MAEFRIVAAVSVAIGLIVAGAVSSHNAIAGKGWSLVVGYIVLEIAGLWLMTVSIDVKIVGTVASLLTLIVYLSRSSAKELDLTQAETKEAAQVKLDFQMEQARASAEHKRAMEAQAAELKHAEKLAKIEARTVQKGAPISVRETVQPRTLETIKADIIAELGQEKPNMSALAQRLNIGRTTLYKHLGTLAEQGEIVKNGNGYEPINS